MKELKGTIVSDKMRRTVVVRVDRIKMHPKYRKYYRLSKRFKAHVDGYEYRVGDTVIIRETRPISKEKQWRVAELVKRAAEESAEGDQQVEEKIPMPKLQ